MTSTQEISRLLAVELAALGDFIVLLQEEQNKLVTGTTDGFEALAVSKLAAADRLNALSAARDRSLLQSGLASGREGMEAWLGSSAASPESRTAWQSLMTALMEARRLNELNGKLIAERLSSNQQALSILTTASNRATLYGPDGQTQVTGGGRKLGSA